VLAKLATALVIVNIGSIVLKCPLQGIHLHFRVNIEVYMGLQFIILMAAITFVILFIITVMIVAIILYAIIGFANK